MRALSLLLAAAYLAAAGVPCPASPERAPAHALATGAHHGHAGHAHPGAAEAQVAERAHRAGAAAPVAEARVSQDTSIAAPCPCGCGDRASFGASPARLGPVLASTPAALALPRGAALTPPPLAAAPEAPTRSLDPVPRSAT